MHGTTPRSGVTDSIAASALVASGSSEPTAGLPAFAVRKRAKCAWSAVSPVSVVLGQQTIRTQTIRTQRIYTQHIYMTYVTANGDDALGPHRRRVPV
jgi:hypothetical protein